MTIDYSAYNILVVDDHEINYTLLKVILEREGFCVFWADCAEKARNILTERHFDLILMDVMMPDMSGFDLAKKLKSTDKLRDIPILFITSLNSTDDIIKGFDSGGSDYVTKPFHKEELLKRIKNQIALVHSRNIIVRQKEELQHAIENRDKLYAIMAHDLRSPISSLKMILNILAMKSNEFSVAQQYVDMLYSSSDIAEKLFSLLDNLLKWTKTSLGVLSYVPQEFELEETVLGAVEVLLPTAKLKNITFDLELADRVSVYFDVDIMKSILRNLLINAVKYSNPDSNILVRLWEEEEMAVVEVKDYGVGMSRQIQEQIKQRLLVNSITGTLKEEGTGLGLWIVQHFIKGNGGEFYFHSEEGVGSVFGIKIPLKQKEEQ